MDETKEGKTTQLPSFNFNVLKQQKAQVVEP